MGRSGVAAGDLLLLMAQNIDVLAGPLVSLAYPLYASIRAIETKNVADDQQWLTYWVLYSMITLFELTFAQVIEWMPFWSYVKLIITCWLVIPQFSGAAYVYEHYIRPFYIGDRTINVFYVPSKKELLAPMQDETPFAAPSSKDLFTPMQDETFFVPPTNDRYTFIPPMQENTLFAADSYIQENGPDAYQDIIQRPDIDREVKYRGNAFFGEDEYVY